MVSSLAKPGPLLAAVVALASCQGAHADLRWIWYGSPIISPFDTSGSWLAAALGDADLNMPPRVMPVSAAFLSGARPSRETMTVGTLSVGFAADAGPEVPRLPEDKPDRAASAIEIGLGLANSRKQENDGRIQPVSPYLRGLGRRGAVRADDCCREHDAPGCFRATCQNTVCALEPHCCEETWDKDCVRLTLVRCDLDCDSVEEPMGPLDAPPLIDGFGMFAARPAGGAGRRGRAAGSGRGSSIDVQGGGGGSRHTRRSFVDLKEISLPMTLAVALGPPVLSFLVIVLLAWVKREP